MKQRSSFAVMIPVSLKTVLNILVASVGKALVAIPFTAKVVLIGCIKNAVE